MQAPNTLPPHLRAILAGSVRAVTPDTATIAAPRALPAVSPLKTRTLSAIVEDMGELETHDSPLCYVEGEEGGGYTGSLSVDTIE